MCLFLGLLQLLYNNIQEMSSINQSNVLNFPHQTFFGRANEKQIKFQHRYSLGDLFASKKQNFINEISPLSKKVNSALYKNTSVVNLKKKPSVLLNSSSSFVYKPNQRQIKFIPIQTEKKIRKKSDQDRETMKRNLQNKVIQAQKALQEIKISFNKRLQEKQQILNHKNLKQTLQIVY